MSDEQFDSEFAKMLAQDEAAPAVAAEAPAAPAATTIPTKAPRAKKADLPNPWGIYIGRTHGVITMAYLRKWAQCSSRGDQYQFNRAVNMNYFISEEFCAQFKDQPVGKYCDAVKTSPRWIDPEHPENFKITPKAPKAEKPAKTEKPAKAAKAPKAAKTAKVEADVSIAAADEAALLMFGNDETPATSAV
jgi:hypothetical protein